MAREMTDEEKKEYDLLTANMEQMQFRLDELMAGPAVYGYARVSTYGQAAHGNSLEEQKRQLRIKQPKIRLQRIKPVKKKHPTPKL